MMVILSMKNSMAKKNNKNILMMKGMIIGIFMEMTKMVFMKMMKMISHIYAISTHVFTAKLSLQNDSG